MSIPIPLPVEKAIEKLGQDVSYARRRRRLSQAMLAERIGTSVRTVRRMERGDITISLQYLARTLHVFGEIDRLSMLLDSSQDSIGLMLMDEQLPERVRTPRRTDVSGAL